VDLTLFSMDKFQAFLICLARVGSLIAVMPVFSGGQVPVRIRVGLAVMLAILVFPVVEATIPAIAFDPFVLALLMAREALVGLMLAFVAQFIFSAVILGGTVVSYKMGFAAANIFDPQTQKQISVVPQFQNVVAILIFLSLDMHHLFLRAIVESFELLTPGTADVSGDAITYIIDLSVTIFVLGVKLSAPVLAILILSSLVLGVMARVFPQLNVFFLSFPLNIGIAFIVIGLTMSLFATILAREFQKLPEQFMTLFELL
jgi:flagellar biosynthetic protein FliR